MEQYKNRVFYMDFLRIAATFAVVVLHVAASLWSKADLSSSAWMVSNIFDSSTRWAVPVFVMISGALFLPPRKINIQDIYKKYILRILISFVVWSAFYALVNNYPEFTLSGLLTSFVCGAYHMWFLFMIVGLYMITPFLRKIAESDKLTNYFLVLSLIFTFFIPSILKIPQLAKAQTLVDNVHFHFTLGYSSYFVAGYFFSHTNLHKRTRIFIYILGIIGLSMTIGLTAYRSFRLGEPNSDFYDNFSIGVLLQSIAIFTFAKYRERRELSNRKASILIHLSKCSFGAYLVHVFVLTVLNKVFGLQASSFTPVLSIPATAIIATVISFLTSYVINKIPVLNKYIV